MIDISIIHPSKNRPKQCAETVEKWLSKAGGSYSIEYIISIDRIESRYKDYQKVSETYGTYLAKRNNKSAIEAINTACKVSNGNLIIVVSDDFDCPDNWAEKLMTALKGKKDFIVKTQDGIQDWIITLPIMDRTYYERFDYIYPPHIKHMFADTWMTHVADLTGRKLTLDLEFTHNHYSTGRSKKDKVNEKNNLTWSDGEKKYLDGVRTNFGLKKEDIIGDLKCDKSFIDWLNKKGAFV